MRKKARQKQLEINQQKKQEEKKKLKKEKQKLKETTELTKEATNGTVNNSNVSKKKNKKEQKKHTKQLQRSKLSSLLLIAIAPIIIWLLFALQFPPAEKLVPHISNYYKTLVELLPHDYRHYGRSFGESVSLLQESTRNISKHGMEIVYNSDVFQSVLIKVGSFVEGSSSNKK